MTEFKSEEKIIPASGTDIYEVLSDLSRIEQVKDKLPTESLDKIKDITCDKDSCTITVDPIGKVRFNVVERIPGSLVRFEAEQAPFAFSLFIHLESISEQETKMYLAVNADLNMFLKPMLSKPLQQGLNKMADILALVPYGKIKNQDSIG